MVKNDWFIKEFMEDEHLKRAFSRPMETLWEMLQIQTQH